MQENMGIQVEVDDKGNRIVGCYPNLYQSAIVWTGKNNVLYCEKGVNLRNTKLTFNGNNSLIVLHASNPRYYELDFSLFSDSVIHMGRGSRARQTLKAVIGEKKHLYIGDYCLFSYGVTLRNADGHTMYNVDDYSRINRAESIYIGDHVWIGQDSLILKGTQIDSGSVIGGNSVLSRKRVNHNSSWAGNPARMIREGVFWDFDFTNDYSDEQLGAAGNYKTLLEMRQASAEDSDRWIYSLSEEESLPWDELEKHLSTGSGSALEKCEYLLSLDERGGKNRFVHK